MDRIGRLLLFFVLAAFVCGLTHLFDLDNGYFTVLQCSVLCLWYLALVPHGLDVQSPTMALPITVVTYLRHCIIPLITPPIVLSRANCIFLHLGLEIIRLSPTLDKQPFLQAVWYTFFSVGLYWIFKWQSACFYSVLACELIRILNAHQRSAVSRGIRNLILFVVLGVVSY